MASDFHFDLGILFQNHPISIQCLGCCRTNIGLVGIEIDRIKHRSWFWCWCRWRRCWGAGGGGAGDGGAGGAVVPVVRGFPQGVSFRASKDFSFAYLNCCYKMVWNECQDSTPPIHDQLEQEQPLPWHIDRVHSSSHQQQWPFEKLLCLVIGHHSFLSDCTSGGNHCPQNEN